MTALSGKREDPQMQKKLFRVISPGGKVEGDFGSKMAAKKLRDKLNDGKTGPWAWVSVGPDHWRWKTDRAVPQRTERDDIRMAESMARSAFAQIEMKEAA